MKGIITAVALTQVLLGKKEKEYTKVGHRLSDLRRELDRVRSTVASPHFSISNDPYYQRAYTEFMESSAKYNELGVFLEELRALLEEIEGELPSNKKKKKDEPERIYE